MRTFGHRLLSPAACALCLCTAAIHAAPLSAPSPASAPASQPHKPTLAVLPLLGGDAKEKALAERMRFAVSQKLSTDTEGRTAGGAFARMDNVQVDNTLSALQIPWSSSAKPPAEEEIQQLLGALDTDYTIAGAIKGRTLSLSLYKGTVLSATASVEIPTDNQSPKLAVEKVLTELTGTAFAHIRDVEADHSDPAVEARFAARHNLVPNPGFEGRGSWEAILQSDHYPPPLLAAVPAKSLAVDRVAIVPKSLATGDARDAGLCLLMRMGKKIAENNGLACESTWIPITQGTKYRFTVRYHSTGPALHLFLKGFATRPDQFGNKGDPEATRREYYRAQVLPRKANAGWETIDMDFTPSSLKSSDPRIEWIRVDLYIYLHPGDVYFDDVTIKKLDP
jgi:hypothetical protein